LLWALGLEVAANAALLVPDPRVRSAGWLLDAAGDLCALAAAFALVVRRGARDLGRVADAAVIGLAAGSVLWGTLPGRLGSDRSLTAQLDLLVGVFALTGAFGGILVLARTAIGPRSALWWLLAALSLAIGGNIVSSVGGGAPLSLTVAAMIFMGVFTAVGLFGLDPTGPRLVYPQARAVSERLSVGRLAFLGAAVAAVPIVAGTHGLLSGNLAGLMLTLQGALVAGVVMARIGILGVERSRAEQALAYQATHDPLTQLPNRREFVTRLREESARGRRCTLLFADLDEFKAVNDKFGHDAGDQLLVDVAKVLRTCVREPYVVSRFGGDEFVILLTDASESDAQAVRSCIMAALNRPFAAVNGARVAASVGIAHADRQPNPEELIKAADHAMYEIKPRRQRGSYR
jgi:diguanylate cyclase (GGDEF)-like protein